MLPVPISNDKRNHMLGDAELGCDRGLRSSSSRVEATYLNDFFRSQLRSVVVLTERIVIPPVKEVSFTTSDPVSVPAFSEHVSCIGNGCAEKEMVGPDTQSDVAMMTDKQFVRDRAEVHPPRNSMRPITLPFAFTSNVSRPIASGRLRPRPQPAFAGLINVVPESLFERDTRIRAPLPKADVMAVCESLASGGLLANCLTAATTTGDVGFHLDILPPSEMDY